MSTLSATQRKTPWHLWAVGALTLFWNGSGAYTTLMAQAGKLADVGAKEAAYYVAQPLWFVVVTDIALFAPIAAAIALLLRRRIAVWLFAVSLLAVLLTNAYDLAAGTSLALADRGWLILTGVIVMLATLQLVYAAAMNRRAVLL